MAISFGVLLYAVSVLITEEAAGSVFSTTVLSTGYGGALLVGGGLAPFVGRRADRLGVRLIFIVGVGLGAGGLTALSVADRPWQVLAAFWILIGPAGALTFYEPAYVAVEQWFGAVRRARSLAILTVVGGLAGPVFLPLSSALVDGLGWRGAARALAGIFVVVGAPAATLMARTAAVHDPATEPEDTSSVLPRLVGDRRFILYTASVALIFLSMQAVLLHRIALFEAGGFAVATAAAWGAAAGLLSFPGRFAAPFLARAWGGLLIQSVALGLLAASVLVTIDATRGWQLVTHFVLFGLVFGAMLPIRASIMGAWYAGPSYGRIMGSQWLVASVAGAVGPAAVGVLRDATGSYDIPMQVITLLLVLAAVLTVASGRAGARRPA